MNTTNNDKKFDLNQIFEKCETEEFKEWFEGVFLKYVQYGSRYEEAARNGLKEVFE